MRKPRDYDSELKALADKARLLKEKQVRAFGELVIACGADALEVEVLAGALLDAVERNDLTIREEWRARGAAFFRAGSRSAARGPQRGTRGASPDGGGKGPAAGEAGPT